MLPGNLYIKENTNTATYITALLKENVTGSEREKGEKKKKTEGQKGRKEGRQVGEMSNNKKKNRKAISEWPAILESASQKITAPLSTAMAVVRYLCVQRKLPQHCIGGGKVPVCAKTAPPSTALVVLGHLCVIILFIFLPCFCS